MAVIEHPLGGLIQGMIEGHQLARQLQQEADAHQAFLTNQMLHNQEMSFNDAQRTMELMSHGARPVVNGMVQEPATTVPGMQPMPGAEGLPTPGPQQVGGILRKPGGNGRFTVTLADSQGNKRQYEMPSPEEQLARQTQAMATAELGTQMAKAQALEQVRQTMLAREGVVVDPRITSILGLPPGFKALQGEIPGLLQEAQKMEAANRLTTKPGEVVTQLPGVLGGPQPGQPGQAPPQPQVDPWIQSLQQAGGVQGPPGAAARWQALLTPRQPAAAAPVAAGAQPGVTPTGPRVIATGGPPLPTGDFQRVFLPAYAEALGKKTVDKLSPKERMAAFSVYKQYDTNPEMMQSIIQNRGMMQLFHASTLANQEFQKGQQSYQFQTGEVDKLGKPVEDLVGRFSRLQDTLSQNTPQADALVAPELLSVMSGGQGSGLRMNQAELNRIVGGRSKWESLKAAVNQWQLDPKKALSITPEQRQEIRALADTVGQKLRQKQDLLTSARQGLVGTNDPLQHRKIVADLHSSLTGIDANMAQPAAGKPPLITTKSDYDKLPSGSIYTESDGKTYRKP